jgi:hypothetical protein
MENRQKRKVKGKRIQMWVAPSFDEAIREWQKEIKTSFDKKPSTVKLTKIIGQRLKMKKRENKL